MKEHRQFYRAIFAILLAAIFSSCRAPMNQAPRLIKDSVIFIYPSEARNKRLEGTVVLRILVDKEGIVREAEIFKSSGYDILDEAALDIARNARFRPARVGGKVRDVWVTWPMVFKISPTLFSVEEWRQKAFEYQFEASSANPRKRAIGQNALYYHYKDLASFMAENRFIYPNDVIMEVISPEVRKRWIKFKDIWPLPFVLFHDFIYRFPESDYYEEAKEYLIEYIKADMVYLKNFSDRSLLSRKEKRELLQAMESFLKEQFSDALER